MPPRKKKAAQPLKGQQSLANFFKTSPKKKKPTPKTGEPKEDVEAMVVDSPSSTSSSVENHASVANQKPAAKSPNKSGKKKDREPLEQRDPSPQKKRAKTEVAAKTPKAEEADPKEEETKEEDSIKIYSVGTKVYKKFEDDWYHGTVTSYDEEAKFYKILYEDNDKEDLTQEELEAILCDKEATTKSGRGCARARASYRDHDDDEDDDDSEDDDAPAKKKRGKAKRASKKDDSDDDFEMGDAKDDEDEEMEFDDDLEEEDISDEESDVESVRPKKKAAKKKPAAKKSSAKKPSAKKSGDRDDDDDDDDMDVDVSPNPTPADNDKYPDFRKKLASDLKEKPKNNPQAWPEFGDYVDPVGVDPTHGIIERIVGEQVQKIGGLLQMVRNQASQGEEEPVLGELQYPIRLQTACSGTDAPSIALGLIQESFNKRVPDKKGMFQYTHEMSCEIEPFKQAYIARNFPGTPLFPDIVKLTQSEEVLDVYGKPQKIPDGNLFIAGTSCKDFSMLKSNRLDIEDKGTSGETFMAAVEFLEEKQPPVAIFENVDGAPWDKMAEYVEGRIHLANRNDFMKKSITSKKAKDGFGDADSKLKFSVQDGRYVVEERPSQVGIRSGAVLKGFVKGSSNDPNNLTPLTCEGNDKKGLLTLKELARQHRINLEQDILVVEKKARYCTKLFKLDTKEYGLPQTRQRKYLFVWRSEDPNDDLGKYFEEIMNHLKTPVLHSMDAFLLPETHDRIRCFREALRSGQGLLVKRERGKEKDFWNWGESKVKDLTLHVAFRKINGIDQLKRWITGWSTRGRKSLAPGTWPELFDCWNMRRLDLIDCFAASAVRDAISRDALHHAYSWDLSQNVSRAPIRMSVVGVAGCVTPGGEQLLPHKGRSLMGFEKLLLQGIPFSRLLLGPETEVQLSDLAGNAMSVSVVCATILAAMCAPHLRRQMEAQKKASIKDFWIKDKYASSNGAVLAERGDLYNVARDSTSANFSEIFVSIAEKLAHEAFQSSVLCTCESSGTTTSSPKILECTGCGWAVCHDCSDRYQTSSHVLHELIGGKEEAARSNPHVFERKLRSEVPSVLRLGEGWEESIENARGLESYSFQLQQVDRKKGHWQLLYGAWEDHGSGRQVAELRVNIGRTATLGAVGFCAYVRCFAPSIRHKKPQRGALGDSARLMYELAGPTPMWETRMPSKKCSLTLADTGLEVCDSQRVKVGLNDDAAKSLAGHNPMKKFIPPIESRNNLLKYHKKWKTWPKSITVKGEDRLDGIYHYVGCEHTVVLSALWRRDASENHPAMYIYIRPNVIRAELDVAVISPTPSYRDGKEICELIDWIPENCLVEKTHVTKAKFLEWSPLSKRLKVQVPQPLLTVALPKASFHEALSSSSDAEPPVLCEVCGLSPQVISSLLEFNDESSVIDLLGRSGPRNSKRLAIIAAPTLLKCAAEERLPLKLAHWYKLEGSSNFGICHINVPPRPAEQWRMAPKGPERFYDEKESAEFFHRLVNRPPAFVVSVDRSSGKLIFRMDPTVAAHRAASKLRAGNAGDIDVEYSLAELSSMGEPDAKEFHVPNSDAYEETHVEGLVLPLYKRQAKALTRMLAIERGEVLFAEEERSEHVLPGIGWCMIARAQRESSLRGGVLGDAIGSGKTVVTIALILAGIKNARANRNVKAGRSGATLIVVPPGLVHQWDDERKKFTKSQLRCIVIDCTDTLKRKTVQELCDADIVICPAGIIEEEIKNKKLRPYTQQLAKKAQSNAIPHAPNSHSQREAPTIEGTWVRNMSSGPEIYVGNKGDQTKRDAQAYYGHCYSEAVQKLREKKFGPAERGVPIEWFTWERVVIDECHQSLVTGSRDEIKKDEEDGFAAKARRGAREFLGVSQTDVKKRPLQAATGVWGLTGTPLLETEDRVTELANLMGGTYVCGAAHHWRKEERESGRDLFLNLSEGVRSREYRCAVQNACDAYVKTACQRNRGQALTVKLFRETCTATMTGEDESAFLKVAASADLAGFALNPSQFGEKAGEALKISASSAARQSALLNTLESILDKEPTTKIIVFANASYGGYTGALKALKKSDMKFCNVNPDDSVQEQNEIISWFRHADATEEDRARPRILLLSFEQAAGHNLQEACHNVVMYDHMYSSGDAVADASVEEQAIGRVMRQGQKNDVTVTRIVLKSPSGGRCLDDWIVERNTDEQTLNAATSNFD